MQVIGDKQVIEALKTLGRGLPTSAVDRSAIAAMQPMLDQAKANARAHRRPFRPKGGHIDENIKIARKTDSTRTLRSFVLGAFGKRKSILTWLEFGTAPHWQPLRRVMHPGARRFPVMRPAYDANHNMVSANFAQGVWAHVQAMILKAARK